MPRWTLTVAVAECLFQGYRPILRHHDSETPSTPESLCGLLGSLRVRTILGREETPRQGFNGKAGRHPWLRLPNRTGGLGRLAHDRCPFFNGEFANTLDSQLTPRPSCFAGRSVGCESRRECQLGKLRRFVGFTLSQSAMNRLTLSLTQLSSKSAQCGVSSSPHDRLGLLLPYRCSSFS
jgi:hypothetical protein